MCARSAGKRAVLSIANVPGLVGWSWHLVLIPLWMPLVIGVVFMILAKLGLYEIDPDG